MSDEDRKWDNDDWQLGMSLPSRKETHGKKKSKKREEEKAAKVVEAPRVQEHVRVQETAHEQEHVRVQETAHEQEHVSVQETAHEQDHVTVETAEHVHASAPERVAATDFAEAQTSEVVATQSAAEAEVRAAVAETAPAQALSADQAVLRDLLAGDSTTMQDMAEPAAPPVTETDDDIENASEDDEDAAPISKWRLRLFLVCMAILMLLIVAYGKLGYVHHVPNIVRQNIPAFNQGEGFLIIKPWWFGSPVFSLDEYPPVQGGDFTIWKNQLGSYVGLLDNPEVLWVFHQDILP